MFGTKFLEIELLEDACLADLQLPDWDERNPSP
jgi:hypothetical protein